MFCIKTAITYGLIMVLLGTVVNKFVAPYFKVELPEACKKWNDKNVMEIALFSMGVLLYVIHYSFNGGLSLYGSSGRSSGSIDSTSYLIVTPKLSDTSLTTPLF